MAGLPRRPLELRLLAALVQQTDASTADLAAGLATPGSTVTAGLLYDRVLKRIGGGVISHLASPGLVLRYVTPELVESVLAPALDLHGLVGPKAEEALDRLAAHTWLVTRDPATGRVWHRRDLRRSVFRLMAGQPTADRVSVAAALHFSTGTADERREAVYHRLLLRRTPEGVDPATVPPEDREAYRRMEPHELKDAFETIRPDIDDLPPPAAALLRFASGKKQPVRDVWQLPQEYFDQAYDKAGRLSVQNREFGDALQLLNRRTGGIGVATSEWEEQVMFATANWERLFESPTAWKSKDHIRWMYYQAICKPNPHLSINTFQALDALAGSSSMQSVPAPIATTVERLAVTMALIRQIAPTATLPGAGATKLLLRMLEPEAVRSALVQHRVFLLGLLEDPLVPTGVLPAPVLLPLDPHRLDALADRPELAPVRLHLRAAALDLRGSRRRVASAQSLLARVDALYKYDDAWQAAMFVPSADAHLDLFPLLRGPDPDFRDPIRFALLAEFNTQGGFRELAEIFRDVLSEVLPDALRPSAYADTFIGAMAADPEHFLESPVELVDRSRRSGRLLRAACDARPASDRLRWVRDAYVRWDGAVSAVLMSRFHTFKENFDGESRPEQDRHPGGDDPGEERGPA